jgi:uncharacterized protein YggU (UPF0235/DUF167 family)
VRPGARRDHVGGAHDGALVVQVRARAVDQAATAAALALLATALGVRPSALSLQRGATSRVKVITVAGNVTELARRRDELLADAI